MEHGVVLFDGYCNFCCRTVNFIIVRDARGYFRFTPLQLAKGKEILREHGFEGQDDTLILVEGGKLFTRSTAVLRIMRKLPGLWKLLYALTIVPRPIRDYFYKLFARYRHKILGRTERCRVPTEEDRGRFL